VDVLDIRHSRSLLEGDEKRLKRALLAFGDDLYVAVGEIPTYADELKLLRAIQHEVAEAYSLHSTLNDRAKALLLTQLWTLSYSAATATGSPVSPDFQAASVSSITRRPHSAGTQFSARPRITSRKP
jgi:hypothetical protein